ncbi:haloalkane dehalogenase [Rubrivirga sp. S365]|uniref:haloalkane dehalogenase n=1 Tax=Rubrivirga sp. S365 TaxID=3076080 RepID=UPI0028C82418|nr:haloalkane dehalogenase [Rubrivirga sp. S365]MDT7856568.1 haloalkane dehalogenase [Rubrivirga sp. S365]
MPHPAPVVRTPDAQFAGLPEWPFAPTYLTLEGLPGAPIPLSVHVVDEGPRDAAETVLLLHGEPSWSYLYRRMIPPLVAAGHRVVAFDFVGFGRSDKLTSVGAYTYELHRRTLLGVMEALDLRGVTLVVQDWGGLVGLPTAALDVPDRVARLVVMNTFLPTGEETPSLAFRAWKAGVGVVRTWLPVGPLMRLALPASQRRFVPAYTAPFPTRASKAGAVAWPLLVPTEPGGPVAAHMTAAREALSRWDKPALLVWSPQDPILGGVARHFERLIPTAGPAVEVRGGHFLQDKSGAEIAGYVLRFMEQTRPGRPT